MKPRPGSNKRRSQKRGGWTVQYDSLEQRQLLATDVGLAFTGSTFQTDSSYYPPDVNGDVGRDHLVEVLNGRINMMGRELRMARPSGYVRHAPRNLPYLSPARVHFF